MTFLLLSQDQNSEFFSVWGEAIPNKENRFLKGNQDLKLYLESKLEFKPEQTGH